MQGGCNAGGGRNKDVKLASFDLLESPGVQLGQFRQALLSHPDSRALSPDGPSELLKQLLNMRVVQDPPLRRYSALTDKVQCAVN